MRGGVEAFLDGVGLILELGELPDPEHAVAADNVGRRDFGVAVLGGVKVEQELDEGALEFGAPVGVKHEAAAGELRARGQSRPGRVSRRVRCGFWAVKLKDGLSPQVRTTGLSSEVLPTGTLA